MYSDKQRLQQIHEHAGVIRSWSEILRLQLVSTYVSRYGSETSCPVYDPVLPKWDGKENITIAHARALKEVETVNIAPIVMETVDIEGLEIVVSDYKPPQPEREESSKRLISDDLEKSDSKRGKFDEREGSPIPNNEDMEEVLLEIDEDTPEITGENAADDLDLDEPSIDKTQCKKKYSDQHWYEMHSHLLMV